MYFWPSTPIPRHLSKPPLSCIQNVDPRKPWLFLKITCWVVKTVSSSSLEKVCAQSGSCTMVFLSVYRSGSTVPTMPVVILPFMEMSLSSLIISTPDWVLEIPRPSGPEQATWASWGELSSQMQMEVSPSWKMTHIVQKLNLTNTENGLEVCEPHQDLCLLLLTWKCLIWKEK